MVRAKFTVTKVASMAGNSAKEITLMPNYDKTIPEDQNFAKFTPSGEMRLYVDNPAASDQLQLGKAFYVDFTEVPEQPKAG